MTSMTHILCESEKHSWFCVLPLPFPPLSAPPFLHPPELSIVACSCSGLIILGCFPPILIDSISDFSPCATLPSLPGARPHSTQFRYPVN